MDVHNVQKILNEVGSIIDKYESISRATGNDFNIFEVTDIATRELAVCRVLYELLLPDGRHGEDCAYLEIFLRDCLGMAFTKTELDDAKVYREHNADGRPIDIYIKLGNRRIPIEVKIYAGDQNNQCYDYVKYAQKEDEDAKIVYLTRFGDYPSEESRRGLGDEKIHCLSFAYDILDWLKRCLSLPGTIGKATVREVIMQFISAIRNFTDQLEDKLMREILDLISEKPENAKAAIVIANSISDMRTKILGKIAEILQSEHSLKLIKRHHDNCYYFSLKNPTTLFQINYGAHSNNVISASVLYNIKTVPEINIDGYKVKETKRIREHEDFYKLFEDEFLKRCAEDIAKHYKSVEGGHEN